MSKRFFGTLHLVVPNWQGDPDMRHESAVKAFRHGPSHIKVAIELWRLADNETRAAKIKELINRAYERDYPLLDTADTEELLQLLDGLEGALEKSVVDRDGNVDPDRLPELRRRTKLLDIDEDRGAMAVVGVSEGLSRVITLRDILKEALERGLHVALD